MHPRSAPLRRLAALAAGVVVCLAAAGAHAQSGKGDYVGRWSVSGGIGYAVPNTDEYGNALAWRAGLGYSPIPQFEFDLELGGFSSAVSQPETDGIPTHDIASGNLDVLPVCLTVQYRTPLPETHGDRSSCWRGPATILSTTRWPTRRVRSSSRAAARDFPTRA